jgi:hypothetical protein
LQYLGALAIVLEELIFDFLNEGIREPNSVLAVFVGISHAQENDRIYNRVVKHILIIDVAHASWFCVVDLPKEHPRD